MQSDIQVWLEKVRCLFCITAGQVVLRLEEAAFVCGHCGTRWGPSYVREVLGHWKTALAGWEPEPPDVREAMDRWKTVLQLVERMPRQDGGR